MNRMRVVVVALLVVVLVVTPWNYPSGGSDKVLADDPLWFGAAGSPYATEQPMDVNAARLANTDAPSMDQIGFEQKAVYMINQIMILGIQ
jgi:hypothetical protein